MSKFAELFDGTRLEFPDDTSDSVIDKVAKQETLARQKQEPKEESSVLRQAADIPVGVAKGFTQGVRMIADAFGADNPVSKTIRGAENYLGDLMSAQAKNDQKKVAQIMKDAEDKGVADQVIAGLKAFTVAPVDLLSQALGTAGPAIVAALAVSNPIGAAATAVGVGATMGAGTLKGSIYDSVKEALADKMPPDQVEARAVLAQEYGGKNLDQILSGAAIGGLSSLTGITPRLIPSMAKSIMEKAATKSTTGRALSAVAGEAVPEAFQAGQEQFAQNVAQQREGVDTPTWRGVAGAATMEGLAGGVLGGGVHAFSRSPSAPQPELAELPSMPTAPVEPVAPEAPVMQPPPVAPFKPTSIPTQDAINQATGVTGGAGYTQADILTPGAPGVRAQAQRMAVQDLNAVGTPRAPMTAENRAAAQQAAYDRATQEMGYGANATAAPEITPAQAQLRQTGQTVTPAFASKVDRQAKLLGQMEGLPQVEQVGLNAQADIATGVGKPGGPGQTVPAQTRFVALEAMTPREARQRLAVLKEDLKTEEMPAELAQFRKQGLQGPQPKGLREPNRSLHIVPHPTIGGRYAIEERVKQTKEAPEPRRADRSSPPSLDQTMRMIQQVGNTGTLTPEVLAAAQYHKLNFILDDYVKRFKQKQIAPDILSQQRQGIADEAALNAELRGGVATPAEVERLNAQGMGRPYDRVQQPGPESRELGLSERERRLNAEDEAARIAANTDPVAIARRRFHEKLQGPELWLEGFNVNPNAEPAPASQKFTDAYLTPEGRTFEGLDVNPKTEPQTFAEKFMQPEGRFSLTATPAMKAVLADPKPLLAMLKRFGLGKVGLRLVDSIRNGTAEGQYAQQLITLAMDNTDPMGVLRHEAIHALKELGAFTDAEWKVLSKAAKDKWINQFYNQDMQNKYQEAYLEAYGNLDGFPEYMQEEAIAQAFRFYTETKPPSGMIANLMRRLDNFFESLRNFFEGKGFQNVDEMFLPNRILADIERGAITPGRAEIGRMGAPAYAFKPTTAPKGIPQNIWDLYKKAERMTAMANERINSEPNAKGVYPRPQDLKREETMSFRRLNKAVEDYVGVQNDGSTTNPAMKMLVRLNELDNIEAKKLSLKPNDWKATPEDKQQAKEYEAENGIDPYLSEGQLKVDVPQARFSLKPAYTPKQVEAGKGDNHPIFGVPVNKNGTITLYLPTNNAEARRVMRDRKLKGDTPEANRIYLTNESDGAKVMKNRGNINHTMDGANVMVQINPEFLQLDQEFADGRKDFFIQIAEGEAFANKMALTKLFTLDAPRDRAISADTTLSEIRDKIKTGVDTYSAMTAKEKKERLRQAKAVLKTQHNVGTLLGENGKLQKTRVGDYGLKFDGNSVASMGLGLASAQKISERLSTCPMSSRCEGLCLGETSGQNWLYGGEGQFKSGPRLSQYLKTEAMVISPEEFAIVLYDEIQKFNTWANKESGTETVTNDAGEKVKIPKQVYQPAIRLNVTSDFPPVTFAPIIEAFPSTEFYDYTKLNKQTIAPNHHLTYSSTGVAQIVNGKTVGIGSNWKEMVEKLDSGKNVAMAFTSRKAMPDFLFDEATEKTYQVWNGDNYDARFLDPKPNEKGNKFNQGMIIGLTNKDRTGRPEDSAIKHDGFFVDYDPARDGKTLTIKDQSKFTKAQPIKIVGKPKFSLRQTSAPEFKQWFGNSKITNPDGTPRVMYHGSANDISEFIGVKAGAVFITADPTIAAGYTELSEEYKIEQMLGELQSRYEAMPLIERQQLIKTALKKGVQQKAISQSGAKQMLQDMADSGFKPESLSQVQEFIIPDLKDKIEARANIMPLYVRAENTFDFDNPDHVAAVSNEVNKLATGDTEPLLRSLSTGYWEAVESDLVQQAVRNLSFDSFFIKELGQKNLAVYSPNQVKSAIGNSGAFSRATGDVRYSIAPLTKLTQNNPTSGQAVINAANAGLTFLKSADQKTNARGRFVDKYSALRQYLKRLSPAGDDVTGGVLRADQLKNAQAQSVNLIKGGLNTGVPVLNADGTIIIERSEDNLARSAMLADKLDSNAYVAQSGYSGRQFVAEIARIRRGQDILNEDADIRAEAARMLVEADRLETVLQQSIKKGVDPQTVASAQNKINAMRKQADEDSQINREKEVKPEHIAWADAQLKAVPEVQEIFDIWKNVNTALVNLYEATGVISKATADKYRANKNYVPLFKSQEDMNEDGSMGFVGGGVKRPPKLFKLQGAEMRRNIWENVQKQYAAMIAASYENQTRREAVRQFKLISSDGMKVIDPADGGANLVYRDNGKDIYVKVDDPNLLMAFQSLPFAVNPVIQFFGGFSKILRAGALLNPMFWLKQIIRDPISATITGGHFVTPVHSAAEFMRVIFNNSEEARILASRGVIGQFDSTLSMEEYIDSLGKQKKKPSSASKLLTKFLEVHEASDAATRIAIFKKAKAKALRDGKSESQAIDYAVHQARESINFAITGSSPTIAALRQIIPFMNATIVGLDTLYRAMKGYGLNAEEKSKAQRMFATKALGLVFMSFAYAMMYQDDDDYKKQPDYVKDGNWLYPVTLDGQRTFVRIPVPYEIGFLFKALPEMMVRYMAGTSTGKEVLASFRGGLIQNLPTGGNPIPQALKPLAEVITNHSFFTNAPLEGMGDQRLPVAQRGEKASEFAKMMSKFGLDQIGLSPVKIDALTKGYFAEFGAFFNELIDFTVAQASGKEKPSRNWANVPAVKSFLTDPNVSKAVGDFYKIEHEAEEVSNLFAKYKKQGDVEGINEIVNDAEKLNQMAASKPLGKIQMQMAKIKNAMKVIENDQSIPPSERRKQLNELQAVFNDLGKLGANIAAQMKLPSAPTPYR